MLESPAHTPTLGALAVVIARDGNLTFGGGTATSEVLRRSLTKRGWITDEDHRQIFALSRLTPGTNLLAYCTGIGWITRGVAGALVAWLASSLPSSILSLGVRASYEWLAASPSLAIGVLVAMTIAVALLASSAWHLAKPFLQWPMASRSAAIMLVAVVAVVAGLTPILTLLAAAAAGALWPRQPWAP